MARPTTFLMGLILLLQIGLVGCLADLDVGDVDAIDGPAIQVDPMLLEFGALEIGTSLTKQVIITNVGTATLDLHGMAIEGTEEFSVDDSSTTTMLEPGGVTSADVTYTFSTSGIASATLHVMSNDPAQSDVEVALEATGLSGSIQLDPADWTFAETEAGCPQSKDITLRNVSAGPVALYDVVYASTSDELTASWPFDPGTILAPGQEQTVTITYAPLDDTPDVGYLYVFIEETEEPDATAIQDGSAVYADEETDTFVPSGGGKVDILWVVDNSCSMNDPQQDLADGFAGFLQTLQQAQLDYQIGVVTTDYGGLQGPEPIMDGNTANLAGAFADAVDLGTAGSSFEKGLQYGTEALTSPLTDPGGANEGFLRADAALRVFYVSNDEDMSADGVAAYVTTLWGLKPFTDLVVLGSATGQSSGCSGGGITASAEVRYTQAVGFTGGVAASICSADWVSDLTDVDWVPMGCDQSFTLGSPALPHTIEVTANGAPLTSGWSYDEGSQSIVIDPGTWLDCGVTLIVNYVPVGSC